MGQARDPVVVVGAGPTGLTLALSLGLAGIPVLLLEAEPALTHDLRAGSYHPPTLEMLEPLGVTARMHETGIKVPQWQIRDRVEGVVAEFDLGLLADETRYPYRLHLEQHRLTPILLERLRESAPSVEVRFGCAVQRVAEDEAGATLWVTDADGTEQEIRASWLFAADGARSVVRRDLGIAFEGFTWPERFLVASTTYDLGQHGVTGAGYIADPEHWAAVFKVPDVGPPGLWRIAYAIPAEADEAVELQDANIQAKLFTIFAHLPLGIAGFDLKYASVYRVHQRVAARFVGRRTMLGGDAAHINNPLGGMGLNGSIHDAVNIADKLLRIWHDGAEAAPLLDLYDRQRRPINIKAVQAMSIRNKKLLEERDPAVRAERLQELRDTVADPVRAKAYLMNSSMINSVRDAAAIQ
jgi:3-(3-hydroxy-phenyl)propionate hydroxylase